MEKLAPESPYEFHPSAGRSYSIGWKIVKAAFIELLIITIIMLFIQGPVGSLRINVDHVHWHWYLAPVVFFAICFGIFVAGPIKYSAKWVYLKAARSEKIEIKDMFAVFQRNYWNAVIAGILVAVIIGIGIVMLIVPGIIFACRLAFVPYLVIDRKMEAMDALKTSWDMTRGYGWEIFGMAMLAIPVALLGILCIGVGVIVSVMLISTAFAVMYHAVELKDGVPTLD